MENFTAQNINQETSMSDCCKKCGSHSTGESFTTSQMALASVLSFIAGVSLVVLVFFILKLERDKKLCFRKKEEPFKGKFEGASKKATIKVLKKHTLERSPGKSMSEKENQKIEIENEKPSLPLESVVNTEVEAEPIEEVKICKIEQNVIENNHGIGNEDNGNILGIETKETGNNENIERKETDKEIHVKGNDDEIKVTIAANQGKIGERNSGQETNEHPEDETVSETGLLKSGDKVVVSSQLFEKSRGSSVYEPENLIFQNDNFRISALSNI